jgi:23S rRNA (guanosine2251-2'-O)-methyltransferase
MSLKKELSYGLDPLQEALDAGKVEKIWVRTDKLEKVKELINKIEKTRPIPTVAVPKEFFPEKEWVGFLPSEVEYLGWDELKYVGDPLIVIDGVTDATNLGTIFRSAVAFSAPNVLLDLHYTGAITPKVVEVSRGAALKCNVWRLNIKQVIPRFKEKGFSIIAMDAHEGEAVYNYDLSGPIALVIGSEDKGIRKTVMALCDSSANIPTDFESLNVHVALSIALYEIKRQRVFKSGSNIC